MQNITYIHAIEKFGSIQPVPWLLMKLAVSGVSTAGLSGAQALSSDINAALPVVARW